MHLGSSPGQRYGKTSRQPAKGLVPQLGIDQHQRRHGDVSPEEAAARFYRAACLGLFASLPVPRVTADNAAAPDRYRTLQVRFLQAERIDQAAPQCALLEARTTLSRRH